jgi:glycosyltransferase involved in cell wall biosynthesis
MIGPDLKVRGGISTVQLNLLAVAHRRSWRLDHIASACDGSKLKKMVKGSKAAYLIVQRLIKNRPDVVHIHFSTGASFLRKAAYLLVARLWQVPTILHCHASHFDVFVDRMPIVLRSRVLQILNRASALIVLSSQWDAYFRHFGVSIPIYVVPNPVPVAPNVTQFSDEPLVLFLGRLGERKGVYDLLEAVPRVLATCPNARFILCGDGEGRKCQSLIDSKPWASRVAIRTWIEAPEREELLGRCALLVLPSYHEGLPVAILEAMAHAIPVVSTNVGGIPDAVEDGVTGYLVNPGDIESLAARMSTLLVDKDLRFEMGTRARSRAESRFESSAVMRHLEGLYDSIALPAFGGSRR